MDARWVDLTTAWSQESNRDPECPEERLRIHYMFEESEAQATARMIGCEERKHSGDRGQPRAVGARYSTHGMAWRYTAH